MLSINYNKRVNSEWNGLPEDVKNARGVADFKRLYRRHRADTVAPASENLWATPDLSCNKSTNILKRVLQYMDR